ncbi:KRAB-A domain-containing protein 2-like, protein [Aphelenchoides besseyi]|nr:KRAB-A domain-containing protein 2-like, protein [Aphelenchoides besseyi]
MRELPGGFNENKETTSLKGKIVDIQADYNVIKRYKRKQIGRKYKLFRKDLLVVRQDKCFGILWSIHVEKGHAGRNIMLKEIKSRGYGGLSNDVVLAFLSCCEFCKLKQGKIKRGVIVKPMVEKQFNDSAQCDLIDFTSKPDGDFRIKMTPYRALFGVDPTPPPLLFNISSDADENAGDLRMEPNECYDLLIVDLQELLLEQLF